MVGEHYVKILDSSRQSFEALQSDTARLEKFVAAHNDAGELDRLTGWMSDRPEQKMFELACLEYQHALFAVAFGKYRQSNVSLRLFLELSLSSVLFSGHELHAQLWLKGKKDINWNSIISKDNGVFSKLFVGAFFEDMKEHCGAYLAIAEVLYRECSEFVHGNHQTFDGLDSNISFHEDAYDSWIDRAETARLVVKFAFVCRFLKNCSKQMKTEIEAIALNHFGDLAPIQAVFAGADDE